MVTIPWELKKSWQLAKWIWPQYFTPRRKRPVDRAEEFQGILPSERNIHVLFRKKFSLDEKPERAILQISVDSRYKLYVNGTYLGRGIPRCENCAWYFDEHDITNFVNEGENVIAIKTVYFGEDLAWYQALDCVKGLNTTEAGKGGLIFEIDVESSSGQHKLIGSDHATRALKLDAYKQDAPKKNGTLGRVDIVDLSRVPQDWTNLEFDDSNWESPLELYNPFEFLIKRNIPFLREFEVNPANIMSCGEVEDAGADLSDSEDDEEIPDFCIKNGMEPNESLKTATIDGMDAIINPHDGAACEITSPGEGRAVYLLLDFGKNVTGYMHLVVEGEAGTIVDMIPSEQCDAGQVNNGDGFHGKRGMSCTLRDGLQEFEQTLWDGFRYVMVKLRNIKKRLKIYRLNTVFTSYPYEENGSFECSNPMLNDLWKACTYTLVLCTHDGYEDCPWREQRSYPGDIYVENLVNLAAFGDYQMGKKFMYDGAFDQLPTGMTFSFFCGDAYAEQHIIPNYQLYWIMVIDAQYLYSGDDGPIRDLYPSLLKALQWWEKYLDPVTGCVKNVPFWKFIDWNDRLDADAEINAIVNAQYWKALQIVAKYSTMLGWDVKASDLLKIADQVRNGINEFLWDDAKGCYHDGLNHGELDGVISQQTNALLIDFNIAPENRWPQMIAVTFDEPAKDSYAIPWPKRGKGMPLQEGEVLLPQPFFMHFVNSMLAKIGRFDLMFKMFNEGWGRMLTHPDFAGTIWETWEQHGSRTHAWSATPAYDLLTYICGIKPVKPGFDEFLITPEFHDLEWVKGTFPSVKGDIKVSMRRNEDIMDFVLGIPVALDKKGIFTSPSIDAASVKAVHVNGKPARISDVVNSSGRVVIKNLPGGTMHILIETES
ncbi:MAG TPA: family 78 glycoside hydrolase catalytic domain [Candidatus Lokiarchaeia archaeon]|nr:family 78 glycoside hydrolase catalytic domain [Candidatus Lokiarchaeia archaeon]